MKLLNDIGLYKLVCNLVPPSFHLILTLRLNSKFQTLLLISIIFETVATFKSGNPTQNNEPKVKTLVQTL